MRKHQALLLFLSLNFIFSESLLAAVPNAAQKTKIAATEQQKLMEELTGKKDSSVAPMNTATKPAVTLTASRRLLDAGQNADAGKFENDWVLKQ